MLHWPSCPLSCKICSQNALQAAREHAILGPHTCALHRKMNCPPLLASMLQVITGPQTSKWPVVQRNSHDEPREPCQSLALALSLAGPPHRRGNLDCQGAPTIHTGQFEVGLMPETYPAQTRVSCQRSRSTSIPAHLSPYGDGGGLIQLPSRSMGSGGLSQKDPAHCRSIRQNIHVLSLDVH